MAIHLLYCRSSKAWSSNFRVKNISLMRYTNLSDVSTCAPRASTLQCKPILSNIKTLLLLSSIVEAQLVRTPASNNNLLPQGAKTLAIWTQLDLLIIRQDAQQLYLATAFILGADRNKYGQLIENLENDYLQGQNNYPQTLTGAYNLLTNWKQDPAAT